MRTLCTRNVLAFAFALAACSGPTPDTPADDGPSPDANDCSAYERDGVTYDCSALDRCDETDLQYRLACCDCDQALCEIDPNCPGDPPPEAAAETCMACHNGSTK